jgi:glycine dehydrogenase
MIEPTESEDKAEIDRFCAALIAIRQEIKAIENVSVDAENNVLHNAPHTHRLLLEEWTLPYSRQQAFFPDNNQHDDKYWPPVGRIDNVYGDRHVVCTCPPLSDYE